MTTSLPLLPIESSARAFVNIESIIRAIIINRVFFIVGFLLDALLLS